MIAGAHHIDLVVTSLDRSLAFYQEVLGWTDSSEIVGEQGERVVYIAPPGIPPSWYGHLGLREKRSDAHAIPYDRYGIGIHHLAFAAESREEVDERARQLRARGIEIESGPQEYDYTPGYYAVFFYDPDGIKLELVHRPPVAGG